MCREPDIEYPTKFHLFVPFLEKKKIIKFQDKDDTQFSYISVSGTQNLGMNDTAFFQPPKLQQQKLEGSQRYYKTKNSTAMKISKLCIRGLKDTYLPKTVQPHVILSYDCRLWCLKCVLHNSLYFTLSQMEHILCVYSEF